MIHFMGTSYAAKTLKEAARRRGVKLTENIEEAELIIVAEDTPTDQFGVRNTDLIRKLIDSCPYGVPIVVTSQVEPGFMRANPRALYHQAETLRIEDGIQRAMYPEMFIVGCVHKLSPILNEYLEYLEVFDCPIIKMSYEDAEFCKIAINAMLISQIATTNMLSDLASKAGADWGKVSQALRHDSRIGKYAYLTPGSWRNSLHLLRDYVSLKSLVEPESRYESLFAGKLLEAWDWL